MLGAVCLPTVATSATPSPESSRLERLAGEIHRLVVERDRFSSRETGVLNRLERLAAESRLLDARIEELRLRREETHHSLGEVLERQAEQERELAESRKHYRATLLLLQRVGPLGRLRPVLDAPNAEKLASGLRLTHELTRRQQKSVLAIRTQLAALEALRVERSGFESQLAELQEKSATSRKELTQAIRSRRSLLRRIRDEKSTRQAALAELERARVELTGIVEGRLQPHPVSLDVRSFRGLLPMPVKGHVSLGFGDRRDPRFGTVIPHPGWDVDVDFGAAIRAPFEGRVAFADWFRGYGLVVVLDHGYGVHSVYAHLSAILVETGDQLPARQLLGRAGDTGSLRGAYLYMEIRESGKAVDPGRWIKR